MGLIPYDRIAPFFPKQHRIVLFLRLRNQSGLVCLEVFIKHALAFLAFLVIFLPSINYELEGPQKQDRAAVEDELSALLGLDKIIWIPGIKGKDITDGHTDFHARFATPGVVLVGYDPDPNSFDHEVTLSHLEILRDATDASGNALEVLTLEAPTDIREASLYEDFAAGYIGFFVCNGAVFIQEFGDATADRAARQTIATAYPDRVIEQINIDGIAAGGGSVHCTTQQEPKA